MTDLKPLAREYMEAHPMNPDAFAHACQYGEPINHYQLPVKEMNTVVRTHARTYRPHQVAEALGISLGQNVTVELTLSLGQTENHLVVTTKTTTRAM